MEARVMELCEAAKRAAEAAVTVDGSETEESRCIDALSQLKKFSITCQILISTQVAKHLRPLTKHPRKNIQSFASDLIFSWKNMFIEQTKKDDKNGGSEGSVKVESTTTETSKAKKVQKTTTSEKFEKISSVETVKVAKINQNDTPNSNKVVKSENHVFSTDLNSMIKCDDALRDSIREKLYEGLLKVSSEACEEIRDEVSSCDPVRVAVMVESVMFETWGKSNGNQKSKYRSILFNLKDPKNPDFRRKVLMGKIKPERLVEMSVEEMASDERRRQNRRIEEKALFECELGGEVKATTDQFKCGRCGQRKTTYYQMQTRSADEPMTTYVTCVNCNHHWKFC